MCIKILTLMYNEPYIQLLQSLAGIYRAYYELVNIDENFKDKVQIVIIADGYEILSEDFLKRCEDAAIYRFKFSFKNYY